MIDIVHHRSKAWGREQERLKSATIMGLVIATCLIAVPLELLELALASVGLSEILPVLAPPIGWPVRIVLALCSAAIAAAITWGTGGDTGPAIGKGDRPGIKRDGIMGWTKSLGLHHLTRLARGGEGGVNAYAAPVGRPMRGLSVVKTEITPTPDLLRRNRKDMHPDAPPRAPLVVSRDLPGAGELSVIEAGPEIAAPPPPIACASPIRDTTSEERLRPLPRSPAPLSDSDLSWVRGLLAERDRMDERPASASAAAAPANTVPYSLPGTTAEADASISLFSLVDRFEQGVAHRIALLDSADAIGRVGGSVADKSAEPAPTVVEDDASDAPGSAMEIDEALNIALETLRKLSVKANGR